MNGMKRYGAGTKNKGTGITDPVNYLCGARGKESSAKGMIRKKKQVSNSCFIMGKKRLSRLDISHKQVSPNPDPINAEQKTCLFIILFFSYLFNLFLARDIYFSSACHNFFLRVVNYAHPIVEFQDRG